MEVLYPHCAGLDVHKNSVVACARHMSGGKVSTKVHTFKTTTEELMAMSAWLTDQGVTHIAMEATGVYWKPVWHILSESHLHESLWQLTARGAIDHFRAYVPANGDEVICI